MKFNTVRDDLIEIIGQNGKARVEAGPRRIKAKATKELLSDDVTAKHYQVGHNDALGKPIELGKDMDYLDWKTRKTAPVWYVYLEEVGKDDVSRFMPKGYYETKDEAISAASDLI